jgi:putative flippase GtrA
MPKLTTKDYSLAAIAGALTGLFIIPVLVNSDYHNKLVFVALPVVVAICWMIGLWLGKVLAPFWNTIFQLAKFAEVGFLNTAIGFGVLNIISLLTHVTSGVEAGGINIPGTIAASINSYLWNKFWVFQKIDKDGVFADVPKFALITFIAIVVNGVIIAAFTSAIQPLGGFNKGAWLNMGKVVATAGSFLINFVGYKFVVFAKKGAKT